jgi:uncharacterized membrane protein
MRKRLRLVLLAFIVGSVLLPSLVGSGQWVEAQYYGGGTDSPTLTFQPKTLTVQPGKAASAKVTVTLGSGKAKATLRAANVPDGMTISFDPASGEPTFTSTMTVKAASTATPGTYTVKVQVAGDAPSAVASYSVTVEKASSGYGY